MAADIVYDVLTVSECRTHNAASMPQPARLLHTVNLCCHYGLIPSRQVNSPTQYHHTFGV